MNEPETVCTVKEACRYLRIGKTKLYELIRDKHIIPVRLGARKTLIQIASLHAHISRCTHT